MNKISTFLSIALSCVGLIVIILVLTYFKLSLHGHAFLAMEAVTLTILGLVTYFTVNSSQRSKKIGKNHPTIQTDFQPLYPNPNPQVISAVHEDPNEQTSVPRQRNSVLKIIAIIFLILTTVSVICEILLMFFKDPEGNFRKFSEPSFDLIPSDEYYLFILMGISMLVVVLNVINSEFARKLIGACASFAINLTIASKAIYWLWIYYEDYIDDAKDRNDQVFLNLFKTENRTRY